MTSSQPAPALTPPRVDELLAGMRGRRIVVVGDAMLDRYLLGDTERLSPEAPVQVVLVNERRHSPGGAANVAANVVALGGFALLVAVIGDDRDGEALRAALLQAGLDDRYLLSLPDRPTTSKTRVVARGQQVVRIDEEEVGPFSEAVLAQLSHHVRDALEEADALVLEDYDKGVLVRPVIREAIVAATARRLPIVADPKSRAFFEYSGAALFKPNRRELSSAIPGIDVGSASDLERAAERLGVEYLLLTLGAEGMHLVSGTKSQPPHRIAGIARQVFDVSGAGDTVTAWAAAALAAGATVNEAAEIANLAASVEVTKAGVATVTPDEVRAASSGLIHR